MSDKDEYAMPDGNVLFEIRQLSYTSREITATVEWMKSRHYDREFVESQISSLSDSLETMQSQLSMLSQNIKRGD